MADPVDEEAEYEEGYGEGVWGDGCEVAEEIDEEVVCLANDREAAEEDDVVCIADPETADEVAVAISPEVEEAYEEYGEEQGGEEPPETEMVGKKSKATGEFYTGLVHRVGPKTGNMLIKSRLVTDQYGMEAMILKSNNPTGAQLCDRVKFKVMEREGQRPLAASVKIIGKVDKIIPDKGKGKGKGGEAKGKSKGKSKPQHQQASSSSSPPTAEIAFAGVVASQSSDKYNIDCENVTAAFGLDAWFNAAEKPANVSTGSLVAFSVSPNGHAQWVCKLAPLADSLWEAQAAAAAERKGPPVRKAITKKAEAKRIK